MGLALRFLGLGWYIAACIVVGILGGLWLDRLAGTKVLFTLLGVGLGLAGSFYGIYKLARPLLRSSGTNKDNSGEDKS